MRYNSTVEALSALWEWCQSQARPVHAPFLTLYTRTYPKLNKKHRETGEPCPYPDGVIREVARYGQIGCSYERCCNSLMLRTFTDDDVPYFHASALWGGKGEHVPGDPFLCRHVDHPERLYLAFKPRQRPSDGSLMVHSDRWLDVASGEEIAVPTVYLPPERELVAGKVPWRTIGVDGILMIVCGGEYVVAA